MAFAARNVQSQENDLLAVKDGKAATIKAGQSLLQQGSKRRCGLTSSALGQKPPC